ncbi:hypothetical protein JTB14_003336 [Gonioctena quinquepunctata]|nr:hypothetical protein JTB14_003336 [Gonioctena quinquepunctata]
MKLEINRLSKAVRKKYLALKLGESGDDETIRKFFKPISKPLKRITSSFPHMTASSSPRMTIAPPPVKQPSPEIRTDESSSEDELDEGSDVERNYPQIALKFVQEILNKSPEIDTIYGPKYDSSGQLRLENTILIINKETGDMKVGEKSF